MSSAPHHVLSAGKIRSLQATSTPQKVFTILAIDHRDALQAMIDKENPNQVPAGQLTDLKLSVTRCLAPQASAVLLDPLYSVAQAIISQALPGNVGLLSAIEAQGYLGDPLTRQTTMLSGWGIEKAKRLGASGVKVLLFYHPEAGIATEKQEQLVRGLVADCQRYDIPLFLEPIAYSPDAAVSKGTPEFATRRRNIIVESARRLSALGPDVLKVEFPIDARYETDRAVWAAACAELDEASAVPWVLLSAGDPFSTFKEQLDVACQAGCSGFIVGRAVWREAVTLQGDARDEFLKTEARQRFKELVDIALKSGRSWQARYALPVIDEHWYRQY